MKEPFEKGLTENFIFGQITILTDICGRAKKSGRKSEITVSEVV